MSTLEVVLAIAGLGAITLLTRCFFFLSDREWPLPPLLKEGLRYAPLAALAAVVVPEIVLTQGELLPTLRDARLPAVIVSTIYFFWRRGILGTIVSGSATMLLFRLGFGW